MRSKRNGGRFAWFVGLALALSACKRQPPDKRCYEATYAMPCGASAWDISVPGYEGQSFFVRGPGSPNDLSGKVLRAKNRFLLCGFVAEQLIDDVECGKMPLFIAEHFRIQPPVSRLVCGEAWGLFDHCLDASGNAAIDQNGPADRLVPTDTDGPQAASRFRCEKAGCLFAN
jgi:hypothetical protein